MISSPFIWRDFVATIYQYDLTSDSLEVGDLVLTVV